MDTTTTLKDKVSRLISTSREYLESKVELEVLKGADKIAQGMSLFTVIFLAAAVGLIVLALLCVGSAILINQAMESEYAGYFIMSGIVLLLALLAIGLGRKTIKKKVINMIINNIDND